MCGIVGVLGLDGCSGQDKFELFFNHLENRGPDSKAITHSADKNAVIGHTRLSIIDIENSHQPMTDKLGRYTITFNGEIYNYSEIRTFLIAEGEEFATNGDTEVLLKLWIRLGHSGLTKLRGQFAFAIYDSLEKKLSLVVDQFGILPLYFMKTRNCFHFSSSLRNIAELHSVKSPTSIKLENQLEYRSLFGQATLFEEIYRLQPGQLIEIKDFEFFQKLWYAEALKKVNSEHNPEFSSSNLTIALSDVFSKRVNEIMVSDVPICLFLSSGIDSNYIRLKVKKETGKELPGIFAIPNTSKSELNQLKTIIGTAMSEVDVLEYSAIDWWQSFKESSLASDTPLSEPADPIINLLSKKASKSFRVAITGEGADEVFQGYKKYQMEQSLLHTPRILRSGVREILLKLLPSSEARYQRYKKVLEIEDPRLRQISYFRTFLNDSHPLNMSFENPILSNDFEVCNDPLFEMMRFDLQCWLPRNLLDRSDNLGLAHSLEIRPFYLEDSILRLGFNSRKSLNKFSRYKSKPALRAVAMSEFGKELGSLSKIGFKFPLAEWLRRELRNEVIEEFKSIHPLILDLLGEKNIQRVLVNHFKMIEDNSLKIFSILSLSHHLKSVL
jgi:asparagine synthase (glutamine-hydrolysing)